MTAETLTAARVGDTLAITSTTPSTGLPTIVIALGPTLTVEIDPSSNLPVLLATEDYTHDKQRIETLLTTDTTTHIDTTGDGAYPLPFTPAPAWNTVLDLAQQQWHFRWNPLPLDPGLLALDLLRAQHEAITLTGNLPDRHLTLTAYPAAQTLQRLIDTNNITPESRDLVIKTLEAAHANTPLNHTDTTPYILPTPLTQEEIRTILTPALPTPTALTTGSPDWRLTGHGPAASAENTITVFPHLTNPAAVTITVPVKPHTHPENTPTYQAFITDPTTGDYIATTTLRYTPTTNTYTGHTTPRRPLKPTDHLDIRHPSLSNTPEANPTQRTTAQKQRQAIRTHTHDLYTHPTHDTPPTLTEHAHTNTLTTPTETTDVHDLELHNDLELFLFSHANSSTTLSAARGGGDSTKQTFDIYTSETTAATIAVTIVDDQIVIVLKDFMRSGMAHLRIIFSTPTGKLTADTIPQILNIRRENEYSVKLPYPDASIETIQIRFTSLPET